ncbi:TPA: 23S rRNA (guanine(1835)-N(2))-methyltransferase RlmG [Salmonella enterica subsp. enterica serovar Paratyphi C]|uniref:Ribosomal RNA large subunit methyltransferase G n=2 Tax=Salmonella enterica TaxID=28901 RepID=C0PYZ3_SALPC|nr:23S rRNA (guanine(1835)-N(2))-methyltransferase RlmG [Salmonella enterica]ECE6940142.1 23S rRNA (guanine(1835)-N(2))-methyltransferase RlmG [Salmonella enterica subsp. enterica serovar Choleraesuis]ECK9418365.1 23S rRNA (guanine(1835)-N(2))-methyltransferase RlmG [Salmonella enterica subsp. enterica serovar Paratyphi C str. CFSAN000604]ACN47381.1 ygjO [Salmonella enterica subsp. enterica serovar Paratyphi C str. RKS4594]EAB5411056.1 23S rRNA (guanine(1835)-N(2))-methyltransferase RlmG [Salmo
MSHVDDGFRSLTLKRFPQTDDVNPLLAWEAADEYLLQQLDETEIRGPVLILNDTFGALSCALAEHSPYSIGDSYLSELGTRENLRHNGIAESSVTFLDSTADYPQAPGVVLIKVPKTLALLEQQLRALRKVVTAQTRIIAGAKARDIHTSTLELFEKVLGPTTTTLAWKKARLINCTFSHPQQADAPQTLSWKLEDTGWTIHNHANVFSRTGLDIGARFFMQHLPENLDGEIVDLGCGNGVIGLSLLAKNPQAKVVFVDESPMAVDSSRLNVETNLPEAFERCEFMINNALSGVEPFRFNAVFCNPPFHQKHALTDNIAWEMFHHARRCLKINGELYIVANRHLDYFHKLKKIFGNCATIATNNKFVILKAVKQGRRR